MFFGDIVVDGQLVTANSQARSGSVDVRFDGGPLEDGSWDLAFTGSDPRASDVAQHRAISSSASN